MGLFKFEISDQVRIIDSGIVGTVVGRTEYYGSERNYYIEYVNNNLISSRWHDEHQLAKVEEESEK